MENFSIFGKEIQLYTYTGIVAESGKNMETRVSGGGGGGYSYNGTGSTAPVRITSHTVVHDQIFMIGPDGNEKSFQLQDFNVACRKENKLTVIWGIKKGKQTGPYIIVRNHTTGETFYNDPAISKLFSNPLLLLAAIIAGIFLAYNLYSSVGWVAIALPIVAIFLLNRQFKMKIREFKSSVNFADYNK
jgi:hypothetical protein